MSTHVAVFLASSLAAVVLVACGVPTHGVAPPAHDASARVQRGDVAETIARFSQATVQHDFDAMASAFDADAVWEASGGGLAFRLQGSTAIRAALASSGDSVEVMFQQIGPPVVQIRDDGRATAETSVFELLRMKNTGKIRCLTGVYRDELVSSSARWAFTRRSFLLRHECDLGKKETEAG